MLTSNPSKPFTQDGIPWLTKTNSIVWAQAVNAYIKSDSRRLAVVNTIVTPQSISVTPVILQLPAWLNNMPNGQDKTDATACYTLALQPVVPVQSHHIDVFDLSCQYKFEYLNQNGVPVLETAAVHNVRMELWTVIITSLHYRQDIPQGIVTFDVKAIWEKVKQSITTVSELELLNQENRFSESKFAEGRKDFKSWIDNSFNEFQGLIQKGSQLSDSRYIKIIMLAISGNPVFDRFIMQHEHNCSTLSVSEFDSLVRVYALQKGIHHGPEERVNLSDGYQDQSRPSKPFRNRSPEEMAELKLVPCKAFAAGNCPWGEKCHRKHDPSLPQTSTSYTAPPGKICWKCKKKGHYANQCKSTKPAPEVKPDRDGDKKEESSHLTQVAPTSTPFYYASFHSREDPPLPILCHGAVDDGMTKTFRTMLEPFPDDSGFDSDSLPDLASDTDSSDDDSDSVPDRIFFLDSGATSHHVVNDPVPDLIERPFSVPSSSTLPTYRDVDFKEGFFQVSTVGGSNVNSVEHQNSNAVGVILFIAGIVLLLFSLPSLLGYHPNSSGRTAVSRLVPLQPRLESHVNDQWCTTTYDDPFTTNVSLASQSNTFPQGAHPGDCGKTFLDSGATSHNCRTDTPRVEHSSQAVNIVVNGVNTSAPVKVTETISSVFNSTGSHSHGKSALMSGVLVIPNTPNNLVSVGKWDQAGGATVMANGKAFLTTDTSFLKSIDPDSIIMEAELINGLYEVKGDFSQEAKSSRSTQHQSFAAIAENHIGSLNKKQILHQRFGHCGTKYLDDLFPVYRNLELGPCDACSTTSQNHSAKSLHGRRAPTAAGQFVQADGSGKIRFPGPQGHRYVMNFYDKFSHEATSTLLHTKDEFFPRLVDFEARLERQGTPLQVLQLDMGTENTDERVRNFCRTKGIKAEYAGPQKHSSIGGVESYHDRQFRGGRAMIHHSGTPKQYLYDAALYWTQIQNRLPRSSQPGSSPLEIARNFTDPGITSDIRVFGCQVWAKVDPNQFPDDHHLADRARRCILLGISEESKDTYILLEIKTGKRIVCSNVKFDETVFPFKLPDTWKAFNHDYSADQLLDHDPLFESEPNDGSLNQVLVEPELNLETRKSGRERIPRDLGPFVSRLSKSEVSVLSRETCEIKEFSLKAAADPSWPTGLKQAQLKPNFESYWKPGMSVEKSAWERLCVLGEWEKMTPEKVVLPLHWIFTEKTKDGVTYAKCRCVAGGHLQKPGQYDQTYAPTLREESLYILLIKAVTFPMCFLATSDCSVAYLNALMDKLLYTTGMPGMEVRPGYCRRIIKAIYGTKQAQKLWRDLYEEILISQGFVESRCDQCVFSLVKGEDFLYLGVHVDDFFSVASNESIYDWFVTETNKHVEMTADKKKALKFIGLNIRRKVSKDISTISVDLSDLIASYLESAGMHKCNPADSPYIAGFDYRKGLLAESEEEKDAIYDWFNQQMGTINYICKARKDMLLWCHLLSRVQHYPGRGVIPHVKKAQRYLQKTKDLPLTFSNRANCSLLKYSSDASHASLAKYHSTGASIGTLGRNTFFAKSNKQKLITVSSTAAEVVQLDVSFSHAQWAVEFCTDLNMPITHGVQFDEDNTSAIQLFTTAQWKTTRWIGVRYHALIQKIKSGFGFLNYVRSDKLLSDHLTKPSKSVITFEAFREEILNLEDARLAGFV
jgi:hypothetical protein